MAPIKAQPHSSYFEQWQKAMEHGLIGGRPFSPATIKIYSLYVHAVLTKYQTVSVDVVKAVLLELPPKNFAKREKIYRALVCFGKFLIEENILPASFLKDIKKYLPKRHIPPKRHTVSEINLTMLLQACKTKEQTLIVSLLANTGIRAQEACNIQMRDLDLIQGCLIIRYSKWGKTRRIGLSQAVIQSIQDYLHDNPRPQPDDFLLHNRYGQQMTRHGLFHRLEGLGQSAGVNVSPHALRRAFVTINANKGRPLQMLQMACGHADITTTRLYCQTSEDEMVRAMTTWS